jgi:tRNA dimethylallyltransferase
MKPKLYVLAGPTASGKTALAIEWARAMNAEIVGADSQQVYRYFDIGTAKPSAEELASVPHHLISVVEPTASFSAAEYRKLAVQAIDDIHKRGKRALVVGGTGLYLRVLLHGVVEAPGKDADYRADIESRAAKEGWPSLHTELAQVDSESAAQIQPTDPIRITRALEIHHQTGMTASQWRKTHSFAEDFYDYQFVYLNPPREQLYEAINVRTRKLFESGLIEETQALAARGFRNAAPMRSVGYAQALQVLDGKMTLDEAIEDTAQKTRNYAKRQLTWFRKERGASPLEKRGQAPFSLGQ